VSRSGPPDQLVRHSFDFTFEAGKELTYGGIATRVRRHLIQPFPLAVAFGDQLFIVNHRQVSTNTHDLSHRSAGLGQTQFLGVRTHRDDIERRAVTANAEPPSCWVVESHR
jgi:hypothetical protein